LGSSVHGVRLWFGRLQSALRPHRS
jgi:hypothetical protein